MPPRYAYWTILIDGKPTAFRARERDELTPTLVQLKRTNPQTELRWFANGRLWDSPEQAQWARRQAAPRGERRDRDWRPGGAHQDPRARFDKARRKGPPREGAKPSAAAGPERPRRPGPAKPGAFRPDRGARNWRGAGGRPGADRPRAGRPDGGAKPRGPRRRR